VTPEMNDALDLVAVAHSSANQPDSTLRALGQALADTVGYKLFTVLLHEPDLRQVRRAYSNLPAEYPVGGAKPISDSPWMKQVLQRGEAYIGRDREDIRTVFFDYELIWSLGCESVLNMPVMWNGAVIATLNLLHEKGWYNDVDPSRLAPLAQLAVPAIQLLHQR
jgi:hypothetical protein